VLGHPGGKTVAELGVGVEPLELVVRARHLEGGPGDLGGARQRGRGARVQQPRPAPHQRDQEKLGHRVQVERQQGAVGVGRLGADRARHRRHRPGGPPVPSRHGDRELQPVVHHGARPNHRRPFVDQPPPGRIPVALRPGQPDPVAVPRHVQGVGAADIGDPGALRRRPDDSGPARQPPPSSDRQVDLGTPPEYQMTAFGEPDDLARRCTHMRGHKNHYRSDWSVPGTPGFGGVRRARDLVNSSLRGVGRRPEPPGWRVGGGEYREGGQRWPRGNPVLLRRRARHLAKTPLAVNGNEPSR
jgi:hypothetical protein